MTETEVDFAVFGTSLQAQLVAGLLAATHARKVALVGESSTAYRLQRHVDISAALLTRPESWALLTKLVPETRKLVARLAPKGWSRLDPIFFADEAEGQEVLAYMRHMASAFGLDVERTPPALLGGGREGIILRDAIVLHPLALEQGIGEWLGEYGVERIASPDQLQMAEGGGQLVADSKALRFRTAVLMDSETILQHLGMSLPSVLSTAKRSCVQTTPARRLASPLMQQAETGLTLLQARDCSLLALGGGTLESFGISLSDLLGTQNAVQQTAQVEFTALMSRDGAPVAGRSDKDGPVLFTGWNGTGAFFAPMLARYLAGSPSAEEEAWIEAHSPVRDPARSTIAEWVPS